MTAFSYSDISTLSTPAGDIGFNGSSGDTLWIDPNLSSGLGVSAVRAPVDNAGQTDGYILHDFFEEGQHLVLAGQVLIRSSVTESGVKTARDALLTGTRLKLKAILRADGTLTFTGGGTLIVRCELLVNPTGGFQKAFVLGLVSAAAA